MSQATAGLGHNNPPELEKILQDDLNNRYQDELGFFNTVLERAEELPKEVTNDIEAGQYSDYIKKLTSQNKTIDAIRKTEKEEYSAKANIVHNFFKKKLDILAGVKQKVEEPLAKYLQAKKDEEDRKRREKLEEERKEAERLRKIEEEKAAEAQRKADEARAEEERIRKANEETKRKADEEAAEIKRKADADAEAIRKKAEEDAKAATEAGAGEAKKIIRDAEKQAKEIVKTAETEAKETVKEATAEIKANDEVVKELHKDAKIAEREVKKVSDDANRQERFADKAERQTLAKTSELTRTRGDASMVSVSEKWIGEVADRDNLDLEALRDHIPMDALNKAVQSWVNANKENRSLLGAHIYQDVKTTVR